MTTETIPNWRERPTISIPEAGALLGLRRAASYRQAKLGFIPTVEIGARRRVVATRPFLETLGLAETEDAPDETGAPS